MSAIAVGVWVRQGKCIGRFVVQAVPRMLLPVSRKRQCEDGRRIRGPKSISMGRLAAESAASGAAKSP
ncbi:hypothetical protein B5E41_10500 [Rhizobium esperanzae]|uniref:Uncharacterized protein n=1 Tax=Rhizobium esperanzae TaxID=1967781 RepID=A0A246DX06_9HYPH|nr:hypothetical protein B5E41_10500 [Rhizobium esperanzae]